MMQKRVSADDLFDLADKITSMAGKAHQTSQAPIVGALNEALTHVLEGAKSAAFNEARTRRLVVESPSESEGPK
jgi:hypothetical protein